MTCPKKVASLDVENDLCFNVSIAAEKIWDSKSETNILVVVAVLPDTKQN